eukprot:365876-Chlamydomonas_euryale.AAC.5
MTDNQSFRTFVCRAAAFSPSYMVPMTMRGSLLDSCADRLDSRSGPVRDSRAKLVWVHDLRPSGNVTADVYEAEYPVWQEEEEGEDGVGSWPGQGGTGQQEAAPQVRRPPNMGHMWRAE